MNIITTNIYLFIIATVLAILEIQVEGKYGWAKNLPTWRPHNSKWYVKFYAIVMGGREFTGYHLAMFSFVLLMFHLPFIFGFPLTLVNWLKMISFYFLFSTLWDFLWFVLNPHYPLNRFKKEHVYWYPKWFLGLPFDYYTALVASFVVLIPIAVKDFSIIGWWTGNILLFGLQTLIITLFTVYLLKIDKWHENP